MKKTILVLFLICSFCITFSALAQSKQKKEPCEDAKSQFEINECARKEYEKVDAELNKVYGQLMPKLEGEHKGKLKAAELAWIKYRDAHCECQAFPYQGGTIYPLIYNTCLSAMTNARIKDLKDLMKGVE